MKNIQSKQEKDRQKMLIEQRKLEEQKRLQEESELKKARAEKKAAKERKRAELKEREERARKNAELEAMTAIRHEMQKTPHEVREKPKEKSSSTSCFGSLWMFLMTLMLLALGFGTSLLWIYTGGRLDQQSVEKAIPLIQNDFNNQWTKISLASQPHIKKLQLNCQWFWEEFKRRNDYVAHWINVNYGPYFCSFKKSAIESFRTVQNQSLLLWEKSKPHLNQGIDWLKQNGKVLWQWLETNIPILLERVYEKCQELYAKAESAYHQWMKT